MGKEARKFPLGVEINSNAYDEMQRLRTWQQSMGSVSWC